MQAARLLGSCPLAGASRSLPGMQPQVAPAGTAPSAQVTG
jgi:hypothetical protein